MIKNDNQLKSAQSRLEDIKHRIEEYRGKFSGVELELYVTPLCYEEAELRKNIEEYLELQHLTFEDAINGPLSKAHLLDNIGELLTKLRLAAKLTQGELADLMGWEQPNISRFESENYNSQTISKVVEYASTLGVWLHVTPSLSESPQEASIHFIKVKSLQQGSFAPTGTSFKTVFEPPSNQWIIGVDTPYSGTHKFSLTEEESWSS
jgi:transcriptional regulator with XRE-family HTH domain